MTLVALACVVVTVLSTLIHFEVLRVTSAMLPRLHMPSRSKLIVVVASTFAAHVTEIALYAVVMYALLHGFDVGTLGLDGTPTFSSILYFSAETYTSLGYGDVVPHGTIRLLAGVEALNGLLLIGWSASFMFVAMERFWTVDSSSDDRAGR